MYKDQRLKKSRDFNTVIRNGSSWANQTLVLICNFSGLIHGRVGFSVSKRVGNAVTRNKIKRRLREIVRQEGVPTGWDIVFIARKKSSIANYGTLCHSVKSLFNQAKLTSQKSCKETNV